MAALGRSDGEGTIIGVQVSLTGILSDANDVTILGKLDGEVHSEKTVTVGEKAQVKGPVTAARVIVAGTVRGNLQIRERVEIMPRGTVTGNIETKDLVIHSGATFNGRSQMTEATAEKEVEKGPEPTQEAPRRVWPPIRLANLTNSIRREKEREEKKTGEKTSGPEAGEALSSDRALSNDREKPPYEVE